MISGEVMPVIGKWLNYMSRLHDGVDAILIADRHGTIEYSAMFSEQENGLADEVSIVPISSPLYSSGKVELTKMVRRP